MAGSLSLRRRVRVAAKRVTSPARVALDRLFDWYLNVDTLSHVGATVDKTKYADQSMYESAAWLHIYLIMRSLRVGATHSVIDYGCGSGRILCAARRAGVRRLIGVEVNNELAELCRRNLQNLRGPDSSFDLKQIDVSEFCPEWASHAFLFNPFGPDTLELVIRRLEEMAHRERSEVLVVYIHPVHRGTIELRDGWRKLTTLRWRLFLHPTVVYSYSGRESSVE